MPSNSNFRQRKSQRPHSALRLRSTPRPTTERVIRRNFWLRIWRLKQRNASCLSCSGASLFFVRASISFSFQFVLCSLSPFVVFFRLLLTAYLPLCVAPTASSRVCVSQATTASIAVLPLSSSPVDRRRSMHVRRCFIRISTVVIW